MKNRILFIIIILLLSSIPLTFCNPDLGTDCDNCNINSIDGNREIEKEYVDFHRFMVPEEDEKLMSAIEKEISENYSFSGKSYITRGTNPSREEIFNIMKEVGLQYDVPAEILYGIGYEESGLRQYYDNGNPIISGDGGIGLMQITPYAVDQDFDEYLLKYDIRYNIEAGAQVILGKWNYVKTRNPIGNNETNILENWYFAIWAYNGYSNINNPNNYLNGPRTWCNSSICWTMYQAYQDQVLETIHTLLGIQITPIPPSSLPSTGIPPYGQSYPTPQPIHYTANGTGGNLPQAETAMHSNGQVEIYMRGSDGQLWHCWQNYNNGWQDSFSNWYTFDSTQVKFNPVAVHQQDGKIVLFAIRHDGATLTRTEIPGQGWTNWQDLGGVSTHQIVAETNQDGRIQYFVKGLTNHVYSKYQLNNNGNTYSNWIDHGGTTEHGPAVTHNDNGSLVAFTRWHTGISAYLKQTSINGVNSWAGWYSAGGFIQEAPTLINHGGYIYQLVRGTDNIVYYKQQVNLNSTASWYGWSRPSDVDFVATSRLAAESNTDGSLDIFARGTDNALWTNRKLSNGNWTGWDSLDGILTSDPEVGRFQDGRLFVLVRGDNGKIFIRRQYSPSSSSWTWYEVVGDDVGRF